MKLALPRIAEFLNVPAPVCGDANALANGYSIDSRTIRPGELFFAVKGEKLDGHDFVAQALENGAIAAVVSQDKMEDLKGCTGVLARAAEPKPAPSAIPLIPVPDTLVALQQLATAVRRLWGKTLVGVTGSAGKTTTKDAIAHVLATRYRVHKSEGNFNNHFGLPLMLLKLEPEHEIAVVEMGMSHAGEITALAKIAQPEIGVVTNVAPVHLEFFDSIAGIARAKYELIESLPATGTAILNADDEFVSQFGRGFKGKVATYGMNPASTIRAENIELRGEHGSGFDVVIGDERERASLPLVGTHNIYNGLAAVATALERGFSQKEAVTALADFVPGEKRGQVVRIGTITVINDCYNSNPKALGAMVDALAAMPAKRRIVVAGEMLELGPQGEQMHRDSGTHMKAKQIDVLIGVRGLARPMVDAAKQAGMRAEFLETPEETGDWLAQNVRAGDVVLMKASRGVKLERALERWKERSAKTSDRA